MGYFYDQKGYSKHRPLMRRHLGISADTVQCLEAANGLGELVHLSGKDRDEDPSFLLLTETNLVAEFGPTGIVRRVVQYNDEHQAEDYDRLRDPNLFTEGETLLERSNAFGYFHSNGRASTEIIREVYSLVQSLVYKDPEIRPPLLEWDAENIEQMFKEANELIPPNAIVPEYNDNMVVLVTSDGCFRVTCGHCPYSTGAAVIYSPSKIERGIKKTRDLETRWHEGHLDIMDELYFAASDTLWNERVRDFMRRGGEIPAEWSDYQKEIESRMQYARILGANGRSKGLGKASIDDIPSLKDIARKARKTFKEVRKTYAFFGIPTILTAGHNYLARLGRYIDRVIVGPETLHGPTSEFIGKPESPEDKILAIQKLHEAGYEKVKPTILIGATGRRFRHNRVWYDSHNALVETVDRLSDGLKQIGRSDGAEPDKVLISRYVKIPRTRLAKEHESGENVKPYESEEELDAEIAWFVDALRKRSILSEVKYESAVEERRKVKLADIR